MKQRCIVIDDEPLALNVLAGYILKTDGLQLVDVTTNPLPGLQRVLAGEADIVFLDIEMPQLHGIEFLKKSGTHCKHILTTAYPDYAVAGYEYSVVDYLLKPISYERFKKAIKKISTPESGSPVLNQQFFFVKSEYKLLRIEYNEVLYLEALRDYVAIHTTKGNKILTLQSMGSFEKELPSDLFIRIHKSYIIAVSRINYIEKSKVIIQNVFLPIGETYRGNLLKYINP